MLFRFAAFFECSVCAAAAATDDNHQHGEEAGGDSSPPVNKQRWSCGPRDVRENFLPPEWLLGSELVLCCHRHIALKIQLHAQCSRRVSTRTFEKCTSGPENAASGEDKQFNLSGNGSVAALSDTGGSSMSEAKVAALLPVKTGAEGVTPRASDEQGLNLSALLTCGNQLHFTRTDMMTRQSSSRFESGEKVRFSGEAVTAGGGSSSLCTRSGEATATTCCCTSACGGGRSSSIELSQQDSSNLLRRSSTLQRLVLRLVRRLHRGFNSSVWLCHVYDDGGGDDDAGGAGNGGLSADEDDEQHDAVRFAEAAPRGSADLRRRHTVAAVPGGKDHHGPHHHRSKATANDSESETTRLSRERCSVVLKVVHKEKCEAAEYSRLSREAQLLAQIDHPHILKLLSQADSQSEQLLFLEYAPLGDLYDATAFKALHEGAGRWVVFQLLLALREVHTKQRLIHGDVKAKNVLLFQDACLYDRLARKPSKTPPVEVTSARMLHSCSLSVWKNVQVKLADFGLAQRLPPGGSGEIAFAGLIGTQGFLAPELLLNQNYNAAVDLWSLGIVTYTLLAGYEPFFPSCHCLCKSVEFDPRYWQDISPDCHDFVARLLAKDPRERMTVEEALAHPWIAEDFFSPVVPRQSLLTM